MPRQVLSPSTRRTPVVGGKRKSSSVGNYTPIAPPLQNPLPPTNHELVMGERPDDLVRVRIWDEDRFERYIHEWAYTLQQKGTYRKIVWAAGPGDKGRDIRAYLVDESGDWDKFQCKHYRTALSPSDVWIELAKLCYYTHQGDFTKPRKYYFVAPHDLCPDLSGLIKKGDEICKQLLLAWRKTGKGSISERLVPLDAALEAYVGSYDFNTIDCLQQRDVIEAIKHTEYYRRVFGCGGLVRPKRDKVPDVPAAKETNYVQELLGAFAQHLKIDLAALTEEVLKKRPDLNNYLKVARTCFYSAEGLERFGRDTFPTAHCFEELQDQGSKKYLQKILEGAKVEADKIRQLERDLTITLDTSRDDYRVASLSENELSELLESLRRGAKSLQELVEKSRTQLAETFTALGPLAERRALRMRRAELLQQIPSTETEPSSTLPANEKTDYDRDAVKAFCDIVKGLLDKWKWDYTEPPLEVTFDEETTDILISGEPRDSFGRTVRAIISSAFIIGMMDYCYSKGLPHPGFVVLDSPLTTKRDRKNADEETEDEEGDDEQQVSDNILNAFFTHLARNYSDRQVVIFDNKESPAYLDAEINHIRFNDPPISNRKGLFPLS